MFSIMGHGFNYGKYFQFWESGLEVWEVFSILRNVSDFVEHRRNHTKTSTDVGH